MKVFISWSGERSKETAEELCKWIRQVIHSAETWISVEIEKGVRWNEKINKELEDTKIGIICLNKENLSSEWILFEAGALSKTSDAHVCTFLLDINPTDIKLPLGQFQHTQFSKEDVRILIRTINNKIVAQKEKTLSEKDIDEIFELFWPKLEEKLNEIKNKDTKTLEPARTDRELLEEILQTVRGQKHVKWDFIGKDNNSLINNDLWGELYTNEDNIFNNILNNNILKKQMSEILASSNDNTYTNSRLRKKILEIAQKEIEKRNKNEGKDEIDDIF